MNNNNNNIFKSVINNIENLIDSLRLGIEVSIVIDGFYLDSDYSSENSEEKVPGYIIQIWGDPDDEYYPEGRLLRQVAFDMDGNPYRFADNGGWKTYFKPVPRDGHQYGGFTPYEIIELVRFRDWIISQRKELA